MTTPGPILDYQGNPDEETYRIGSLRYTPAGLIKVFVWMLWGSVIFSLVESVFPPSMQLQLTRLNVPPFWLNILMSTLAQSINMLMVVPVGFRSDRTRTRLGRRIPFILGSMPLVFVSLAALGYTDDIGRILNHAGWPQRLHLNVLVLTIVIVGVMITTFDISNVFVTSMNDYLVADVIPRKMLARFMGASSVAGQLAGVLFNFLVLGQIERHPKIIYFCAAVLYVIGFGLICLNVREGEYPPPHDYRKHQSVFTSISVFFHEAFSHPLYASMYIATGVWAANFACNNFRLIFYTKTCHFDLSDIGYVKGWTGLAAMVLSLPIGWLVDKIHPIRGFIISVGLTIPFLFASFYMPNFRWFVWIAIFTLPMDIMMGCSEGPLRMRIFPAKQYGQFAAATASLRSAIVLISTVIGGAFMQLMVHFHGQAGYAYCFLWQGTVAVAALVCLLNVYRNWRKYGDQSSADAEDVPALEEAVEAK